MKPSRAQRKQQTAVAVVPQAQVPVKVEVIMVPPPQPAPMVEICRSFSYTFQARQFEPRNFSCSFKTQCAPDMAEEAARSADEFCQDEVLKSVKEYRSKMAAQRGRVQHEPRRRAVA